MSFPDTPAPTFYTLSDGVPMARAADSVSATISQDRTAGATAAEESSFGMLAGHDTAGAHHGSTINPALLGDTTQNPYGPPPSNNGAPQGHSMNPAQLAQHQHQQLTPWGAEFQRLASGPYPQQGVNNLALQDYQMQLMLLEQQNKKRLQMARQEQDGTPADVDKGSCQSAPSKHSASSDYHLHLKQLEQQSEKRLAMFGRKQDGTPAGVDVDVGQPVPSGHDEPKVQNSKATTEENPPRPASATNEATTTQTDQPAANKPDGQADVPSPAIFMRQQATTAMQPPPAVVQCFQPPALPTFGMPQMSPAHAAHMAATRAPRLQLDPKPATSPAGLPQTTPARAALMAAMRAARPKPGPHSGANPEMMPQLAAHRTAMLEAVRVAQSRINPQSPSMHIPTVQQLAAQRRAVQDGELMAWSLASEREKSLQESNNKLKAQVAQLWDMNRKMIPVAPGQTFPGPPAILMAENEKSLFSDGSSGPLVQPVQCNQLAAPETEKEMSQDEDFIPDILLPGPGLPYQSEQQADSNTQIQPSSPGNGRKRSRDDTAVKTGPVASTSNTIDLTGDECDLGSSLREKRSRIVPINTLPEDQSASAEDNDWECVAVSPPTADKSTAFDGQVADFGESLLSTNDAVEDPIDVRTPSSPCTLPDVDDALMVDVDADAPRHTKVVEENTNEGSTTSTSIGVIDEDPHAYFRTLYRVHCSRPACRGKTYADIPLSRENHAAGSHHIAGDTLISDFKAYVALNRDVRFYVFRDYECPKQASRDWTKPDESTSNEIHVVSDELKRTLTSISRCLPDGDTQSRSNTNGFNRPPPSDGVYRPRFLYHHREILQNILANEPFRADVKALLWFLGHESPDYGRLKTCDFLFNQGKVCANTLPWLFCPNSMVIATKRGPDSNIPAAYVLEDWPIEIDGGLQLNCWSWGYDGQRLQRRQICLTVKVARDAIVDITSLSVYPAKNMVDEVRQKLVSRGQQFWGYRHQHHVSYQGWDYQKERKYGQGSRCMIDYQTYRKFHGAATAFSFSRSAKALYDRWPESISNNSYLSEDNFMLLPPEIHGFFLKDKRWVCLCLDQITPVAWNKLAFERLVLPQKTKTLVQAMVMPRANKDADAEPEVRGDLIAGKGNGLIMLLHGPPGTGKTLTAESVAELAELPLYSVTCGDIGTSPEAVERYLNTVLHLGKTWNCVLLLDEADVFLEQRSMADLDRNSLVSVFLRTLEYYSGILILTSNRVSIFDEAFKSRIQVALSYPRLDKASRKRVWANFINMIHEDGGRGPTEAGAKFCVDYPGIVSHMDDLADCELNGRQIRNAMATARQLAGYLGETLNWGHLETAITTASDFTISQSAP